VPQAGNANHRAPAKPRAISIISKKYTKKYSRDFYLYNLRLTPAAGDAYGRDVKPVPFAS
jgi:hypothetical protein